MLRQRVTSKFPTSSAGPEASRSEQSLPQQLRQIAIDVRSITGSPCENPRAVTMAGLHVADRIERLTSQLDGAATAAGEVKAAPNPAVQFLAECFAADPSAAEPLSVLVTHFNAWHGGEPVSYRKVTAMLRKATSAGEAVIRKRRLSVEDGGQVVRCLVGYRYTGPQRPSAADLAVPPRTSKRGVQRCRKV